MKFLFPIISILVISFVALLPSTANAQMPQVYAVGAMFQSDDATLMYNFNAIESNQPVYQVYNVNVIVDYYENGAPLGGYVDEGINYAEIPVYIPVTIGNYYQQISYYSLRPVDICGGGIDYFGFSICYGGDYFFPYTFEGRCVPVCFPAALILLGAFLMESQALPNVQITGPTSINVGEPFVQITTRTDPPGGMLSNWRITGGDGVCVELTTDGKIKAFAPGTVGITVDYTQSGQKATSNQFNMTLTAVPQHVVITYTSAADTILSTAFTNSADVTAIKQRVVSNLTTLIRTQAGANFVVGPPTTGITSVTTLEVRGNTTSGKGGEAGFDLLNKNRTQNIWIAIGTGSLDLANREDPVAATPDHERQNKDRVADAITRLAAHEIGHALGLVGQAAEFTSPTFNALATKLNVIALDLKGTPTHHNPTDNDINLMEAETNILKETGWNIVRYQFEGKEKNYLDRILP